MYTSESGEWKLGGFDILSSMNDEDAIIYVGVHPFEGSGALWLTFCRPTAVYFRTQLATVRLRSAKEGGKS